MVQPTRAATTVRTFVALVVIACAALTCNSARGAWVGYNFTATSLVAPPKTTFGFTLTTLSPISGHLIYDTSVPADTSPSLMLGSGCLNAGTSCAAYRQSYPGGLTGAINNLSISADDYVIIVSDHFPQAGMPGVFADTVSIRWASNLGISPAFASLMVNGAPQAAGFYSLNLQGPDSLLSNASLPSNLTAFSSRLGLLADPTPSLAALDIVFNIAPLVSFQVTAPAAGGGVPEPGCGMLVVLGLASLRYGAWLRGRNRRRHE